MPPRTLIYGDRDLRLGPLRFDTLLDGATEDVGGGLEAQGALAMLAERTTRPVAISLPVRGADGDEDRQQMALRLQRQVRAFFNNDRLTAAGVFLVADELDPNLVAWIMCGGGQVATKDGGALWGDFELQLSGAVRVGTMQTHRSGRRVTVADRRLATTAIDVLGRRTGQPWTNANAVPLPVFWLPPSAVDELMPGGTLPAAASVTRASRQGQLVGNVTPAASSGGVVSFEQQQSKVGAGDVQAFDRRGAVDVELLHPYGFPSTIPANVFANPYPRRDATGYTGTGGATVGFGAGNGPTHKNGTVTQGQITVNTDGSVAGQGAYVIGVPGYTFRRGRTYRFSWRVRRSIGTLNLELLAGRLGADTNSAFSNPQANWNVVRSVDWTPAQDWPSGEVGLQARNQASGAAMNMQLAHAAVMDVTDIPVDKRPTHALYNDGEMPGCSWTGQPDNSATTYQAARVNFHPNPDFHPDGAGGGVQPGGALHVAFTQERPRRSTQQRSLRLRTINPQAGTEIRYQYGLSGLSDDAQHAPDQAFRMQGQIMTLSAWRFLDAAAPALTAGHLDRLLLVAGSSASASTTASAAQATPRQWVREIVTIRFSAVEYTDIIVRHYNPYDDTDVYWADGQLELGTIATPQISGDNAEATWIGPVGSVSGVSVEHDPERGNGWERLFGPDQDLSNDDAPVIDNGLVRCRWVPATGTIAVDTATPEGGWQEQGRLHASEANTPCTTLRTASIAELSGDRLVLRLILTTAAGVSPARRVETYLTLQRGWAGVRPEAYVLSDQNVALTWTNHPMNSYRADGLDMLWWPFGRTAQGSIAPWQVDGDLFTPAASDEPWVAMGRAMTPSGVGASRPAGGRVVTISVLRPGPLLVRPVDRTTAYGTAAHAIVVDSAFNAALRGWVSARIDFTTQSDRRGADGDNGGGVLYDAENYPSASGTRTVGTGDSAARGGASGGYVAETQTAETANTLQIPATGIGAPRPGRYGAWILARATTAAGTLKLYPQAGSSLTAAVPVSTPYVWIYLGETTKTDTSTVTVNAIAGSGGSVRIDALALIPLERRAAHAANDSLYDGVRDHAQQNLADTRQTPVLVAR